MKHTTRTGAAALVLLGSTALALGPSGPGTAGPSGHETTMKVVARHLASKQLGHNRLVETDKILTAGKVIGFSANTCAFDFSTSTAKCAIAVALQRGQLRARVTVNADAADGSAKGVIVGGTGAYQGARGTVSSVPGHRQGDAKITMHITTKSP
jgi:hypothetical protein